MKIAEEYVGYIYRITNKNNGKMYIGKTTINPVSRYLQHLTNSKQICKNTKFYFALQSDGVESFVFDIVETVIEYSVLLFNAKLREREMFYIGKYETHIIGYNTSVEGILIGEYKKAKIEIIENQRVWYYGRYKKVPLRIYENIIQASENTGYATFIIERLIRNGFETKNGESFRYGNYNYDQI